MIVYLGWLVVVAWACLALVQLWWSPLSGALFIKLSITMLVVLLVMGISQLLFREYRREKQLERDGFIDG